MISNFRQKSKGFFQIFLIFSKSIDIPFGGGYNVLSNSNLWGVRHDGYIQRTAEPTG